MADESRRSFLHWACHGLGAIFAAVLGVPAVLYLVDPRNRAAAQGNKRPVSGIKLSEIKTEEPRQGVIRDVRRDAWTLHPNDVIGRVWVVRLDDGSDATCFKVFTTTCPHLGCSINCNTAPTVHFKCPCHDAEFNKDGTRVARSGFQNKAPRDMDSLEFEVARDPENPDPGNRDLLLVKFQSFKAGEADKQART